MAINPTNEKLVEGWLIKLAIVSWGINTNKHITANIEITVNDGKRVPTFYCATSERLTFSPLVFCLMPNL